MAGSD